MRVAILASVLLVTASVAGQPAPDVETFEYTVEAGDTCGGIARRFYGQWRRYDVILRFNPELAGDEPVQRGRCGPFLRPGVVLRLPRTLDGVPPPGARVEPDARVTSVSRRVQAREPERDDWQRAERGLSLFRGWRVNTLERASAELTFRDESVVYMRQNTLVVIYGGTERAARRRTTQATLERGALRSRLGELRLQVDTPSATTQLEGGAALVAVDGEGASRVSNFRGGAARVEARAGGRVAVRPGFGSKVLRGGRPSPPRRLPNPPRWVQGQPTRFVGVRSEGGTLRGEWTPVDGARAYRIEIGNGEPGRAVFAATEVGGEITRFELHRLPAGTYWARVSTIDGDFFESPPSRAATFELALASLQVPGVEPRDDIVPDPSVAPSTPRVVSGTRIIAPEGAVCVPELLLEIGTVEVACNDDDGSALGRFALEVFAAEVDADADEDEDEEDVEPEPDEADSEPEPDDPDSEADEEVIVHPPSWVHEAFALSPHPALLGLTDERRRGHALHLAFESFPSNQLRVAAGGEIAFLEHARIGAIMNVDFAEDDDVPARRGERDVYGFATWHIVRSAQWGWSFELGAFFPTGEGRGSFGTVLAAPSLSFSYRALDRLTVRSRQGALLDLGRTGELSWASAYGLDVRAFRSFSIGAELDLVIGRDEARDELLTRLAFGLGMALRHGMVSGSLGLRYAATNDLQARMGDLQLSLGMRVAFE